MSLPQPPVSLAAAADRSTDHTAQLRSNFQLRHRPSLSRTLINLNLSLVLALHSSSLPHRALRCRSCIANSVVPLARVSTPIQDRCLH